MAVDRWHAEQGLVVRLRAFFRRNDALFDPESISRVEIHRRTGATETELVETIDGASVVQESQGVFYVDWLIPTNQTVGAYVDRWFFIRDSGDAEEFDDAEFAVLFPDSISGGEGYITPAEVREGYLPNSQLTDAEIDTLIDIATETINLGTGRTFGGTSETLHVNGTGQSWIVLPKHIQSIESITVETCAGQTTSLDPDDFVIQGRWLVHKCFLPSRYKWERDGCFVCGCTFGDIFSMGQNNVAIEGVFGMYAEVPASIRHAAGLLVMYGGADDSRRSPMAFNYDAESTEQHSYTRRATDYLSAIVLRGHTGIPEVDAILNRYRAIAGRMFVV